MTSQRPRHPARPPRPTALLLAVAIVAAASVAIAQDDPTAPPPTPPPSTIHHVAGSDGHLWIVQTTEPAPGANAPAGANKPPRSTIELLHRGPDDPADWIYREMRMTSKPAHVAASGKTLWLLHNDRSVQSITVTQSAKTGPRIVKTVQNAPLPRRGTIRFWAADESGPVVLIENDEPVEPEAEPEPNPAVEPDADTTDEPDAEDEPDAVRLPEIYDRFVNPSDYFDDPEDATAAADRPRLELIRSGSLGWESIAVPKVVRPERVKGLLTLGERRYVLVGDHAPEAGFTLHAHLDGKWTDRTYAQRLTEPWDAVTVSGNVFVVMRARPRTRFLLAPHLAPFGSQLVSEAELKQMWMINVQSEVERWWATSGEGSIVVVAKHTTGELKWTSEDVSSEAHMAPQVKALRIGDPPPPLPQPMTIVMVAAMMIGMLFLLGGGKREAGSPVYVPRGTRPAGKVRIYAALVDLAPPLVIAMLTFGIANPVDILTGWLEHPDEWRPMAPGLTVIGLFVLHTTLTELFTGATLGKLLFKVRVVSMTGLPPNVWQVLARNSFKVIEMMPPFLLLVVPMLNRFRQRLGDLVSRTLVVAPQQQAQRNDTSDRDDDLSDDDRDERDDPKR